MRSAAIWMSSPSNLKIALRRASQRRSALAAMVSNTGCTSPGEAEITCRIWLIAACCADASARRCSSCRPVEPSKGCDLPATADLASALAFAGLAPFPTRAVLATLKRRNRTAMDNSVRRRLISRKISVPCSGRPFLCASGTGPKQQPERPSSGNNRFGVRRLSSPAPANSRYRRGCRTAALGRWTRPLSR